MTLLGIGTFDPMGLILALIEAPDRDHLGINLIGISTVEPSSPGLEPIDQELGRVSVTTAALPVNQAACVTIVSLPDPQLVGLFFK